MEIPFILIVAFMAICFLCGFGAGMIIMFRLCSADHLRNIKRLRKILSDKNKVDKCINDAYQRGFIKGTETFMEQNTVSNYNGNYYY